MSDTDDRQGVKPIYLLAGLYLSNFIRGGVEVLDIEVDDRANA